MFDPSPAARVFALPLGVDFSRRFVDGLLARLAGHPPEALARTVIYVNTRRSARLLETVLSETGARLLPDIRVIGDLAQDPVLDQPRAIPSLRRRLVLARLVEAFIDRQPDIAPKSAIFDLAESLEALLDSFQGEGIAIEALQTIDVGQQSGHWERSLAFLEILGDYWMHHRPENAPDREERQRAVAVAYARLWEKFPPGHPVIVAGSTGSRGSTALFMEAVAKLPQGAIVLPGFDYDMPAGVWDKTAADHPQYGFRALSEGLGFDRPPPLWADCSAPVPARNRVVSLALRPAPVTDQWLDEGPALRDTLGAAMDKVTIIEAPSPRAEAEAIAIRLRTAAEAGQSAALVSPDRVLARRVSAILQHWKITPDDSAGRPLPLTPPGVFLRRLVTLAGAPLLPVDLLALLKHPLCGGSGAARAAHLKHTRWLELHALRGGAPFVDWQALQTGAPEDMEPWLAGLQQVLAPLADVPETLPLADWVVLHQQAALALSRGTSDTPPPLFEKEAGQAARAVFDRLHGESGAAAPLTLAQYHALFQQELNKEEVREQAFLPYPGVAILGTLEARVQSADLVILGGLNEGVWPAAPQPDTWMSRDMRRQIGLPLPERQTGLSAHDFQQAIAAPEVVLSRAVRDGESPTVASRWMIRLTNLLEGLKPDGQGALAAMRERGQGLLALALALNTPDKMQAPAPRPSPAPPVSARPDTLSVTRIETLSRDPYAIYADKVLRLRPLPPLGRAADAMARGTALHRVLEVFVQETRDGLPENAGEIFIKTAETVLDADVPWPSTRRFWRARLAKIAPWFIATERERRERGRPLKTETSGQRKMQSPPFTLTAKADRLDLMAGGRLAIYDYKSGALPTKKQALAFSKQLPLEGAIAAAGGFEGVAAARTGHLELIGLGSGGKTLPLDYDDAAIDKVWAELCELIASYATPTRGYTARMRVEKRAFGGDYDHLSRFGEWLDGEDFETEVLE